MKNLILLISIFSSTTIWAKTSPEINFAKCIQKTALSARNTADSLDQIANLILKFSKTENSAEIVDLEKDCREIKESLTNFRRVKNSKRLNEFKEFSTVSVQSAKLKKIMSELYVPTMECQTADVRASVAFFLGITAGVGGGICKSTNGEKFVIFAPEAGAVEGIEVSVMGGLKSFRTNAYGLFAAEDNQDYGGFSWGLIGVETGDFSRTDSVGIGMAIAVDLYYVGTLKLLRVERNLKTLVKKLKTTNL